MRCELFLIPTEVVKQIEGGRTSSSQILDEVTASDMLSCNLERYWLGLDFLLSSLESKSELKHFLTKGGIIGADVKPALDPLRAFEAKEVKRLQALITRIGFDALRGSTTLHELASKEIYPFSPSDNATRVFLELKRVFEDLKIFIAEADKRASAILIAVIHEEDGATIN